MLFLRLLYEHNNNSTSYIRSNDNNEEADGIDLEFCEMAAVFFVKQKK